MSVQLCLQEDGYEKPVKVPNGFLYYSFYYDLSVCGDS